jgi:hypothetical protein
MNRDSEIVAGRHGLSLGWQVAIVVVMGLVSTTGTATAIYFGLRGAIDAEVRRNDEQDRELQRKADKAEVAVLQAVDATILNRMDRERSDVKETLSEIKQQLRELNAAIQKLSEDRTKH